jgi:maspardin
VLKNLPTEPQEPEIAASIDFMVEQLETLTGDELSSRLILNCSDNYIRSSALKFEGKAVTMIDVLDHVAVPQKLRDEMYKFFPDAKIAHLRTGGNFPCVFPCCCWC